MVVSHQVFRVFEKIDFEGMKKNTQRCNRIPKFSMKTQWFALISIDFDPILYQMRPILDALWMAVTFFIDIAA